VRRGSSLILAIGILLPWMVSCAGLVHGWTLSSYQGRLLATESAEGKLALQIQRDFSPPLDRYVADRANPTYLFVERTSVVWLVYSDSPRAIRATRDFFGSGTAEEFASLPTHLARLLSPSVEPRHDGTPIETQHAQNDGPKAQEPDRPRNVAPARRGLEPEPEADEVVEAHSSQERDRGLGGAGESDDRAEQDQGAESYAPVQVTPGEPRGLRVKKDAYSTIEGVLVVPDEKVLIPWSVGLEHVLALLGEDDGDRFWCHSYPGITTCELRYSGWSADYDMGYGLLYPARLDFYRDRFFRYAIDYTAGSFDSFERALHSQLGEPASVEHEIVQNRMGAKFQQTILVWNLPNTSVVAYSIFENLEWGRLVVTYSPIAETVPKESPSELPF
jgi:hypothetical protein